MIIYETQINTPGIKCISRNNLWISFDNKLFINIVDNENESILEHNCWNISQ